MKIKLNSLCKHYLHKNTAMMFFSCYVAGEQIVLLGVFVKLINKNKRAPTPPCNYSSSSSSSTSQAYKQSFVIDFFFSHPASMCERFKDLLNTYLKQFTHSFFNTNLRLSIDLILILLKKYKSGYASKNIPFRTCVCH